MEPEKRVWKNMRRKSLYNKQDEIGFMYRKEDEQEDMIDVPRLEQEEEAMDDDPRQSHEAIEAANLSDQEDMLPSELDSSFDEDICRDQAIVNVQFYQLLNDLSQHFKQNNDTKTADEIEANSKAIINECGTLFREALEEKIFIPKSARGKKLQERLNRYQTEIKQWDELMVSKPVPLPEIELDTQQYLTEDQLQILQQLQSNPESDMFIEETQARVNAIDQKLDEELSKLRTEHDQLVNQIETYKTQNLLPILQIQETPRTLARDLISAAAMPIETPY